MDLKFILAAATLGSLALLPADVSADGYENVPIGSRTAAMGGAAIAGGWDSAMPTLNPSGLALIPNSVASLSASLYQTSAINIDNYVSDGDTIPHPAGNLNVSEPGVDSLEFGSFPSGLAYFLHLGDKDMPMTLAASLSVPKHINRRFILNTEFQGQEDGASIGVSVSDSITTIVFEEQYMAAISWAAALGKLRVGVSALGSYTSFARTADRSQFIAQGTANFRRELIKEATFIDSFDMGAVAGVQYEIGDWLGLGLTLRTPSFHIHGALKRSIDLTQIENGEEPFVQASQIFGDKATARGFPMRIGAGVVLRGDSWSVALDGLFYRPRGAEYQLVGKTVKSQVGGTDERPDREEDLKAEIPRNNVFNFAIGLEYALTDANWLRAGFFTEKTADTKADEVVKNQKGANPEFLFTFPIDRYGASLGLGTKLGPIDTTVGVRTTFGSGGTPRYAPDEIFANDRSKRYLDTTPATVIDTVVFISAAVDVSAEVEKMEKMQLMDNTQQCVEPEGAKQ